jgi:hypothetical protein
MSLMYAMPVSCGLSGNDRDMHSLRVRTRFNLLREGWQIARDRFPVVELPKSLDTYAVSAQLHATILEIVGGCIVLFERANYVSLPVLLRVAHEALAEQFALACDRNYLKNMIATTLHEARSLPEQINRQQRGLLQDFLAQPGARDFLGHVKDSAAELADEGGARTEPEDKFKAAGLENEYPLYRTLNGAVHNDFGVLQMRHAEPDSQGRKWLVVGRVPPELDLLNMLDSALGTLLRSYRSLRGGDGAMKPVFDKFMALLKSEGQERKGLSMPHLERYKGTRPQRPKDK